MAEGEQAGDDSSDHYAAPVAEAKQRPLSSIARRALAEAAERRALAQTDQQPAEQGGRGGLDPVRYSDWEVKGLASDF